MEKNETTRQDEELYTDPSGTDTGALDGESAEWGQFEQALGDVVSRLSNIGHGQYDAVVTSCLHAVAQVLGIERCVLLEMSPHNGFRVTHSWSDEGIPPLSPQTITEDELPWYTRQIRSGHIVCFSSSNALPAIAIKERSFVLTHGVKLNITVPLLIEGLIIGAVGFSCLEKELIVTPSLMSRLRLAGEVLALGIRHYQYAKGLESINQTMDQLALMRRGQSVGQPEQLRYIAAKIMQSEHQERLRMGQVLQEDVMQTLAGIGMLMKSACMGEATPQTDTIAHSMELLTEALRKLQQLTMQLRPGMCPGALIQNIRWLANQMKRADDLDIEILADEAIEPVSDEVGTYIYNATRKFLEGVATSSGSRHVELEIRRLADQWIALTIKNDGIGVTSLSADDGSAESFDMLSIRELVELLGGRLEIYRLPGEAAKIIITIRG